jgi:NAD(P)-dependent dehydrogenase (short-subunit alcohol dehydrogenase family)
LRRSSQASEHAHLKELTALHDGSPNNAELISSGIIVPKRIMSKRVAGKVAIVTGAGSGMGRAGATLLASEGAKVVVADINETTGTRVCRSISDAAGEATFIKVNVLSSESVRAMAEATVARYGRIDVLYHNAIDVRFVNEEDRRLTELPEETWDHMINLVLNGTFRCCKHVGQQMLNQKSGSIILTATVDALIGCAGLDAYTAAKGGVIALTRSFAAGMAKEGVRVNAVCPGFVTTEPQLSWIDKEEAQQMMKMLHLLPVATPEQIAPFIVYLASDESAVVTGGIFPIDSGYMAFKANVDLMGAASGKQ